MYRIKLLLVLFAFCCWQGYGQKKAGSGTDYFKDLPKKASPKEIGKKIAERFMATPHTNFGNKNGKKPDHITYPDVCTWYGAFQYAKLTKDADLSKRLLEKTSLLLGSESNLVPIPKNVDYTVFGVLPLEAFIQTKDSAYFKLGIKSADAQFKTLSTEEYDKLPQEVKNWYKEGLSWQTRFWMDDMYMITSIQVQAYRATKNEQYINRAAREMVAYLDTLQNPDGLFFHAPDVPHYWGRGDGWLAAGMAELLQSLPKNNLYRPKIMSGYLKMMQALLANQTESGLWRQLITDKSAWVETSGSAMFTFAFITGVKNGWLPASTYGKAAQKAWISLTGYLDENFDLKEICEGTNKKNDRQYYLDRKRITGDLHGQAPMLWCVNALLQ